MALFALLHGSGDGGWAWHLVQRTLHDRGHESLAPDLPTDDEVASWHDCTDVVAAAVAGRDDVVVVGQSGGGFVVPLAAERVAARLQVYVAGLVPRPGETPEEWFGAVGWFDAVTEDSDVVTSSVLDPSSSRRRSQPRPTQPSSVSGCVRRR